MIRKSYNDKEQEIHSLRQQIENKRMQVNDANKKANDLMIQMKMIEKESEKRRR